MIIALDYDDTYTVEPDVFDHLISELITKGHTVSFVTYRYPDRKQGNADIEADAERMGIEIIYTSGRQKREVINADIWIDDKPELIPTLSSLQTEFAFRKQRRVKSNARR